MSCNWVEPILSALRAYLSEGVLRRVQEELYYCKKITWFFDPAKKIYFGVFFHFHYPYRLMVWYERHRGITVFLELEYGFFKQVELVFDERWEEYEGLFHLLNDLCLEAKGCYLTDIIYAETGRAM